MSKQPKQPKKPFKEVVSALLDNSKPFSPTYLHRFSDLNAQDIRTLADAWPRVRADRRQALLVDLLDIYESDLQASFDALATYALDDTDVEIRLLAIQLLRETEDMNLLPKFLEMAEKDTESEVRAAATAALGLFVFLGELEELPDHLKTLVEERLLKTMNSSEEKLVKRRALEAVSFSGRSEVTPLIEEAYRSDDLEWKVSALFAMGRSANEHWQAPVMQMLQDGNTELQFEAVRAAGELELEPALPILLEMVEDYDNLDSDLRMAIVSAISKIGGDGVEEALSALLKKTDDEEEHEFIVDSMDYLMLMKNMPLGMFDFDDPAVLDVDEEDDELTSIVEEILKQEPPKAEEDNHRNNGNNKPRKRH